jgi:hypothetical protein
VLGRVVKHQPGVCTAGGLLISSAFTRQADETRAQLERTADGQELLRQIDAQSTRPSRPGVESGPGFMSKFRQATAERNAQKVGPGSSCISTPFPLFSSDLRLPLSPSVFKFGPIVVRTVPPTASLMRPAAATATLRPLPRRGALGTSGRRTSATCPARTESKWAPFGRWREGKTFASHGAVFASGSRDGGDHHRIHCT